jgi:hypothetical protein
MNDRMEEVLCRVRCWTEKMKRKIVQRIPRRWQWLDIKLQPGGTDQRDAMVLSLGHYHISNIKTVVSALYWDDVIL